MKLTGVRRLSVSLLMLIVAGPARAQPDAGSMLAEAQALEKAGRLEEAEAAYRRLARTYPKDRQACSALGAFLNRPLWLGKSLFDEAIATLERCAAIDPKDAAGFQSLAMAYWDRAYNDRELDNARKDAYATKGLESVDKALQLRPDSYEAVTYKGLLYRMKAAAATSDSLRTQYLDRANALSKQGQELKAKLDMQSKYGGDPALKGFAEALEASVNAADVPAISRAIDLDSMLDAAMRGEASAELRAEYKRGFREKGDIAKVLAGAVGKGGHYRFLRIRKDSSGRPRALFRLLTADGGVNYNEYLVQQGGGGARATDVYVYASGEWMTESVRREWLYALAQTGFLQQLKGLAGAESDLAAVVPLVQSVSSLEAAGQHRAALDTWMKLPASYQTLKHSLVRRVSLARRVGDAEYAQAVEAFQRAQPGDPALQLMQIDIYFARKQYDQALAVIDALDAALDGDPYLEFQRGTLYYLKGDRPAAKAALARITRAEPALALPYNVLVQIALDEKDFGQVATLLTAARDKARIALPDLATIPAYAEFVRSPEYRSWAESAGSGTGGAIGGVTGGLTAPPPPPPAPPAAIRVGGAIKEPRKLKDVRPIYPPIAQSARVQGIVILECTISPEGKVVDARIVRGIPLLDQAAIDAVKQWEYAPTLLDNMPVAVIMTVTVNFTLM